MPDSVEPGLARRSDTVRVGEKQFYLIGGERLDQNFLATLVLPENMRALYRNLEPDFTASCAHHYPRPGSAGKPFAPLVPKYWTAAELQRNRLERPARGSQLSQILTRFLSRAATMIYWEFSW